MRKFLGLCLLFAAVASFAAAPSTSNGYDGSDYKIFLCSSSGDSLKGATDTSYLLVNQKPVQGQLYISRPALTGTTDSLKIALQVVAKDPYGVTLHVTNVDSFTTVGGEMCAIPLLGGALYDLRCVSYTGSGAEAVFLPNIWGIINATVQTARGAGAAAFKFVSKVGAQ